MLGFSVKIEHKEKAIGYWYDDGNVLASLNTLVERGLAERNLDAQSGYPSIFRIQYRNLPALLRLGISPMHWYGFKLDTETFFGNQTDYVTITLWDQS